MDERQFDLWWAFRLAFSDFPNVRVYTRDHRDRDLRPGYSSGRFVIPAAPPITVHLYHEEIGALNTAFHDEAHYPAALVDGEVYSIYESDEEWAREIRRRFDYSTLYV